MLAAVLRRAVLCLLVAGGVAACAQQPADTPAARQQAADRGFLLRRGMGPSQGDVSLPMHAARSTQTAQARGVVPFAAAGTAAPALSSSSTTWQPAGPTQLSTPAYGLVTGRISSLAVDPNISSGNTVYLGTTGGGVWKSINGAAGDASSVSFIPLTDDLPDFANSFTSIPSLSIGALTVQPGNPQVLLAGTGDPNNALDSYYGVGILRSGDGGNTWKLIQNSSETSPFLLGGIGFSGFAWNKKTSGLVVAAASQSLDALLVNSSGTVQSSGEMGLYYSTDAGQTWYLATVTDGPNQIILSSNPRRGPPGIAVTSVVWNSQRNLFLAAIRSHGYYSSPDGMTWTRLANQPGASLNTQACRSGQSCPIFRGVLAVQQATGDTFALTTDINDIDQGLYQDVCSTSGLPVSSCNSGTIAFGTRISDTPLQSGNGVIAQADYNLVLSAVPTQSQQDTILLAGTEDIFRCSLANSCIWRNTTNDQTCAAAQVAPSAHAIEIGNSANGLIYFGNDGGLWRTTDAVAQTGSVCASTDASHYQNLNGGIGSLAEISHLAVSPSNGSLILAGMGGFGVVGSESASAQNGTGAWQQLLTGEGSFVAIDPNTPNTWYADSGAGVSIFSCTGGGNCNAAGFGNAPVIGRAQVQDDTDYLVTNGLDPAPWILDPSNSAAILLGTCRMWLGPVSGNWTSGNLLSTAFDTKQNTFCNGNATVRSVGAGGSYNSPQGGEQMYAGMAGPHDGGGSVPGHLYGAVVPQTGGKVTWSDLWRNPVVNTPLSKRFNYGGNAISSIAVDPHDVSGRTVYAGIGAFPTGSDGLLYGSTDGGQTWFNLTNTLPIAPITSVVVDPAVDPADSSHVHVYVGGDFGVYYTTNVAACAVTGRGFTNCWAQLGGNLPNAPVTDLKIYNIPSGGGSARSGYVWPRHMDYCAADKRGQRAGNAFPWQLSVWLVWRGHTCSHHKLHTIQ